MQETPGSTRFPPYPSPLFSSAGHPLFAWQVDPLASTHDERTWVGWLFGRMDGVMAWRGRVQGRLREMVGLGGAAEEGGGPGGAGQRAEAGVGTGAAPVGRVGEGREKTSWQGLEDERGTSFLADHELGWNPDRDRRALR